MLLNYLPCYILFIPLIIANNTTFTIISSTEKTVRSETNKTNSPVLSEGGPINLQSTSSIAPLIQNHDTLLSIEGLAEPKPAESSISKIVARKGVEKDYPGNSTDRNTKLRQDTTTNHTSVTIGANKTVTKSPHDDSKSSSISSKAPIASNNESSTASVTKHQESNTEKPVPKKPLILSYEKLDQMNESAPAVAKMPTVQSSSKTIVADQIASSKLEPPVTVKSAISRGHPEMVIPVVITMIVVPLFAVLGYMALKRGKEAWRNRHYKRMDFLLDGMYNE